jgi:TrmH family RNA methyltransferase
MKVSEIISPDNQRLKIIRCLAEPGGRKDQSDGENLFLLEGAKLIQEALNKKIELIDVIVSQSYFTNDFNSSRLAQQLDGITVVQDRIFKSLYTTDTSCGIIATAVQRLRHLDDLISDTLQSKTKVLLLADSLQDPGNLGTIIRTAHAFQAGGMIISKGSVDCYSPKVVRSSMGAIFSLAIVSKADLNLAIDKLKASLFRVIALDGKADKPFWQEPLNIAKAYILGNEGHGISSDILSLVDETVAIPINPECESLNVAVAAGIILAQEKVKNA